MNIITTTDNTAALIAYTQQTKTCTCGAPIQQYQTHCSKCEAKIRYITINAKWEKFLSEIKQFSQHYILEYSSSYPEEITGIFRENPFDSVWVRIVRERSYRGGYSALRIATNSWKYKASRLKKDFDAKDIAKLLHKRCNEILGKMSDEITEQLNEERKKKEKTEHLKNEFQNIKNYKSNDNNYVNFKNTRVATAEKTKTLEDGTTKITSYATIYINSNISRFSLQQIKDMVDALYSKFNNIRDRKDFTFNIGSSFSIEDIKKVVTDMETILE